MGSNAFIGGIAGGATVAIILKAVDEFSKVFDNATSSLGKIKIGSAAVAGIIGKMSISASKAAVKFEGLEVSMGALLGSTDQAQKKLKELSDFAMKTPFSIEGVELSARQLIAFGFTADEVIPTLKAVGDVAAGVGQDQSGLLRILHNLGQVKAVGKLTGRELRDFGVNLVPILDQLALDFGVSTAKIKEMTTNGEILEEHVTRAFINMSKEGGRFANFMTEQMKTTAAKVQNLDDAFLRIKRTMGELLLPAISVVVDALTTLLNKFNALPDSVKKGIGTGIITLGAGAGALTSGLSIIDRLAKAKESVQTVTKGILGTFLNPMWVLIHPGSGRASFPGMPGGIGSIIKQVAIGTTIGSTVSTIVATLSNPLVLTAIATAIASLAAGFAISGALAGMEEKKAIKKAGVMGLTPEDEQLAINKTQEQSAKHVNSVLNEQITLQDGLNQQMIQTNNGFSERMFQSVLEGELIRIKNERSYKTSETLKLLDEAERKRQLLLKQQDEGLVELTANEKKFIDESWKLNESFVNGKINAELLKEEMKKLNVTIEEFAFSTIHTAEEMLAASLKLKEMGIPIPESGVEAYNMAKYLEERTSGKIPKHKSYFPSELEQAYQEERNRIKETYGSPEQAVRTAYGQAAARERREAMNVSVNIDGGRYTTSNMVAKATD